MDDRRFSSLMMALTALTTAGLVALVMVIYRRRVPSASIVEKAEDIEAARAMIPEAQRAFDRLQELIGSRVDAKSVSGKLRDAQGRVIEFSQAVTPEVVSRVKKARARAGQVDGQKIAAVLQFLPGRMPIDLQEAGSRARVGIGQAAGMARQGLSTTQAAIDRGVGTAVAAAPRIEEILDEAWHGGMRSLRGVSADLTRRGTKVAQAPARAGEAIGEGVDRAEQEARDFGAMLFWLGVAGGVAYLLMSPEQRQRLMSSVRKVLSDMLPGGRPGQTSGNSEVTH